MFRDETFERLAETLVTTTSATAVLSAIAYWLALAGREIYRGAEEPDDVVGFARLRCLNEIQIVLGEQLQSLAAGGPLAYPNAALIHALRERALLGDLDAQLQWAVDKALTSKAT